MISMCVRPALLLITLSIWALVPPAAEAQQSCAQPVAVLETAVNDVEIVQAVTSAAVRGARRVAVCAGDTIRVGDNSRAIIITVASGTSLAIEQNSELVVTASSPAAGTFIDLLRGALLFITRVRRQIEVRTPFVTAAVEGTEFVVRVEADRTTVTVLAGLVRASNPAGMLLVGAGEQVVALMGQAPQLQIPVRPRDAVQWALYYQPLMPGDTFQQVEAVPVADRNAAFFVRRASLLLAVGQLEAARADLNQAEKLDPGNADVLSLRTIIAVALDEPDEALQSGRLAVERAPRSTPARLALSYALQANFQLQAARNVVEEAVADDGTDAVLYARLAELRLMLDDVGGAERAGARAAELAPALGRAHVVRGFTLLAQLRLSEANAAFERALELESANPLAHLGVGLVKIRRGDLDGGRSDLELAVTLDPDNALLRSYLGKAYFDEKREALATEQFELAEAFDPRDPTASFYHAIQQQALNRPVSALRNLERSIRINDNRAVYRSRLLLHQDLSARGTNLSRIYADLGFEQLALVQGWKSVAVDPSNQAAHRLLADNYLTLPAHQIARDSELLQSQLLQRANVSPVQPRLASNGLNFLEDLGISRANLNEFTPLFSANGVRLTADAIAGTQGTGADNVIFSALVNRMSFSAGHFYFTTDGLRPNHLLTQRIWNLFYQADITESTSVLAEYRRTDNVEGDRALLFDPDFFDTDVRSDYDVSSARVGFRHAFSPAGTLLGTYAYQRLNSDFRTRFLGVLDRDSAHFVEVRYLHRWNGANLSGGVGSFNSDGVEQQSFDGTVLPSESLDTLHVNAYLYATLNPKPSIALTAGLGADGLQDDLIGERRQLNPKFGATWSVAPGTFVRAAAFRVLHRSLVSGQTIEPTHVGGFNQFFDDGVGADAWRYGVGVDQQLWVHGHVGAELSFRDLSVPSFFPAIGSISEADVDEHLARVYVYATISDSMATTVEYQYARVFDPEGSNPWLLERSTTHKVPVQATVHLGAVMARARATYVDQRGTFRNSMFDLFDGEDQFVVTDVSVGYRFPNRWGVLSVDVKNLFDRRFRFQDHIPRDSGIAPRRQAVVRLQVRL